ncbi:hypothetical protein Rleg10DRAFT_5794 [Rhizobium leguminosarum bv. trifolii WSM2012]|nr:hypothetical protein Rleg10DRAFT_4192 [Rhizobium leguminosarum bv. trifolii WSM2012]EJC77100.1 hypothetical protein Rleg10DRAFT_5794 [Rhizobium leguminosarum bv. trifolii WSM2012]
MTQATTYSVPLVGPATPTVMAQRIDDNFDAIISGQSGASRPSYAVAGTVWQDTSVAGVVKYYHFDGSDDILLRTVDTTNNRVDQAPQPLVDVASASTPDIGAVKSRNIRITGTNTITGLGTVNAGTARTLYFAAALTLTYNATSLITPTAADVGVLAGDCVDVVSLGSGNWRVLRHVPAVSTWEYISRTVVSGSPAIIDFTNLGSYRALRLTGWVSGAGATGGIQFRVSANNGSSYDSGASDYTQQIITASSTALAAGSATSGSMQISATAGVTRMSINATVTGFNQATRSTAHVHCYGIDNSGVLVETVVGGERNSNVAHSAFRLLLAAGTFSGGELVLEGMR